MSKTLDVYLGFGSPFSYVAQTQLAGLVERTQCDIAYHMVDLRKVFQITGNASPISVPLKRKYVVKDLQDWCRHYNITFNLPSCLPINTRPALAGAVIAQNLGKLPEFIETVMHAYFVEDWDIADQQVLEKLAESVGLNAQAVAAAASDPNINEDIDAKAEAAAKRGVFGAPTFFIGDDMYWGNDRLMFVEQALMR